jgi:broad specificity phosphatase PhoE
MLTVFYSPHATSTDNEAGRASGHADVLLSALGQQRAQQLGAHYAAEAFDAVLCSDLQRAQVTAQIAFSDRGLPIIPDARLREFDYGTMTQCPRDDLHLEQHIREPFPEGESVKMAVERVGNFLQEVRHAYDGQTIVVIGHVATRYGLEYALGQASLEAIVQAVWEWREVPIWRYEYG